MISKYAVIDKSAKIGADVSIGPFSVIGAEVEIGDGTHIASNVVIDKCTKIGKHNKIFQFASIGADPQDKKYRGEKTYLEIGDRNEMREFCTIHRGTVQDKGITKIGHDNLFMNYVHIAHDCIVGDHTVFSNNASLAGHVVVQDHVVFGGFVAVYQFCNIGAYSFITGGSLVLKDVLPYTKISHGDEYARSFGLNGVGLKRHGLSRETIARLRLAYKIICRQGLLVDEAIEKLQPLLAECPEINHMIDMLRNSKNGILR